MVMYKNDIPLIPSEEIGYHIGLIVHPDKAKYFYNVRTSTEKPPAGYGTRIYLPEFEPNVAFKKLDIPLTLKIKAISDISSGDDLRKILEQVEVANSDALLCFNHGALVDDKDKDWGHVVVFDRVIDGKIRIVDPSPEHPKWRLVGVEKMFGAMQEHGVARSGGVWLIEKKEQ
jgi:hypothetical protein